MWLLMFVVIASSCGTATPSTVPTDPAAGPSNTEPGVAREVDPEAVPEAFVFPAELVLDLADCRPETTAYAYPSGEGSTEVQVVGPVDDRCVVRVHARDFIQLCRQPLGVVEAPVMVAFDEVRVDWTPAEADNCELLRGEAPTAGGRPALLTIDVAACAPEQPAIVVDGTVTPIDIVGPEGDSCVVAIGERVGDSPPPACRIPSSAGTVDVVALAGQIVIDRGDASFCPEPTAL